METWGEEWQGNAAFCAGPWVGMSHVTIVRLNSHGDSLFITTIIWKIPTPALGLFQLLGNTATRQQGL